MKTSAWLGLAFVSVLGSSIAALACGGTSAGSAATTPSDDGGASTDASADGAADGTQACTDYATARCQKADSCTAGLASRERFSDLATCIARGVLACKAALGATDTAATPAFFSSCAMALPMSSCADFQDAVNVPEACLNVAGSRANGAACSNSAQCTSSWCKVSPNAACGTCGDRPAAGAACNGDAECGARGLFCSKANTCEPLQAASAPCDDARVCGAGLSCVGQTKTLPGACQPAGATVGAACDPKRTTAAGCDNRLGLYCGVDDKCADVALVMAPSACGALIDASDGGADAGPKDVTVTRCLAGASCAPTTAARGTCVAPAADGAACDTVNGPPCLSPARCILASDASTAGTCQLPGASACQ
jgi:hypothetical protein